MSLSKYKINPVRATCMKYDCTNHGIQGINDTCFNICAAYSGTYDTFEMDPQCVRSCTELVEERKRQLFGVGSCDHQVPYRPVAWEQVPRYVPNMLKRGYSPLEAKNTCIDLCKTTSLVRECQENCIVDYNAIEPYETLPFKPKSVQNISLKTEKKDHPIVFYTLLLLIFLVLGAIGYYVLKKY